MELVYQQCPFHKENVPTFISSVHRMNKSDILQEYVFAEDSFFFGFIVLLMFALEFVEFKINMTGSLWSYKFCHWVECIDMAISWSRKGIASQI